MARETQKGKIGRLEKEIEMWRELSSKMQKELSELRELADDNYEKSSTYIQQCKKIELLEGQNEAYKLSAEHEKKMRSKLGENYEPEIKKLKDEIQKLKAENSKLNIKITHEMIYNHEMMQEIETLNNKIRLDAEFYKDDDTMKQKLSETLIISAQQTSRVIELENMIKELNANRGQEHQVPKIHNERGAGRKSRFTEQEKESIRMYRLQGKTMKEIAEMFSCSVGIIHKLIHEK